MKNSFILGTGSCLPRREVSNHDLESIVDTSDEWITTRTGIKSRRIAGPGEETSKIAAHASRQALDMAGVTAQEIDLIICGTMTSEMSMPSCACLAQKELGAVKAFAYDINAACCGFLYGLDLADAYVRRDPDLKILVIGAENLSARTNWQDRTTCVLWGDGAGAVVVTGTSSYDYGLLGSKLYADGTLSHLLSMNSAKGMNPDLLNANNKGSYIKMEGKDVFKYAVKSMENAVVQVLKKQNMTIEDISYVIPHQANIRILNSLLERLSVPPEKVYVNIHKYGNTSAASIPIALDEANRLGKLHRGDTVLFCAFGGGFTWGASIVKW
nr:ketoacyl-ACP synthase III [Desulfobulbaceae bacterium]